MIEIETLSNGLPIIVDTVDAVETCAVGFWTEVGSRDERADEHGVCHLLEHMAFKGTATRDARAIAEAVEDVGGTINAGTGFERTGYFIRILKNDVGVAVDLLGDIITNSLYDPVELTREQQVVIQEIAEAADIPEDLLFDRLQGLVFHGQALGRPILGTRASVSSFTPETLRDFHSRHIQAGKSVLSISGSVTMEQVLPLAEAAFAGLRRAGPSSARAPASFRGGGARVAKQEGHTHLALAWPTADGRSEDRFAARILGEILGGGMSSRLFQTARERLALCYTIFSFVDSYVDAGLLGVYAATEAERAGPLQDIIHQELEAIAAKVDDRELARAKAQMKSGVAMAMESLPARAEGCAGHYLRFGAPISPQDLTAMVDAVTADDIRRMAARAIESESAAAVLGPSSPLRMAEAGERAFEPADLKSASTL